MSAEDFLRNWMNKNINVNKEYVHQIGEFKTLKLKLIDTKSTWRTMKHAGGDHSFKTYELYLIDEDKVIYQTTNDTNKFNYEDFTEVKVKVVSHGVYKHNQRLHVIKLVESCL